MENYIPIGFTKKIYGTKGEMKLSISEPYIEDLANAAAVFLMVAAQPTPYFIEDIYYKGDLIIKLEDVDSPEAARPLAGTELFLRSSDVTAEAEKLLQEGQTLDYQHLIGYVLVDMVKGDVGRIETVESYPQQEIATVKKGKMEWLIPLNEEFIQEVDDKKKQILVALPEGLLDLQ